MEEEYYSQSRDKPEGADIMSSSTKSKKKTDVETFTVPQGAEPVASFGSRATNATVGGIILQQDDDDAP